jgi:hypothetical protein
MARPLVLSLDGREFSVSIRKISREQLYGSVEIEAYDEKGNPATLMVLAADGKTLLDRGGSALAMVDEKGNSIERKTLKPVDLEGNPIEQVTSSFSQPNVLKKADTDEYLAQIVKSIYVIDPFGEEDISYLLDHLSGGLLYHFPFSYRGGTEYDDAFVVGNDRDAFMIIGKPANLEFVKLNQVAVLDNVEEQEISGDEIDFDLI